MKKQIFITFIITILLLCTSCGISKKVNTDNESKQENLSNSEQLLAKMTLEEKVVITDALEMGAITNMYSSSESAVNAILAGVDIVLMPYDFVEAYDGVYNAVKSGVITEERINESVLRILNLKEQYLNK